MAVPSIRPIRNCLYGHHIEFTGRHSYQPVSRAHFGAPASARVQEGCARSRGALTLLNAPPVAAIFDSIGNCWHSCRACFAILDPGHFGQSHLDISCPISGHFGPALVCSNPILGSFWPVYSGFNIDIEAVIN